MRKFRLLMTCFIMCFILIPVSVHADTCCPDCNGQGQITSYRPCTMCDGEGFFLETKPKYCSKCQGSGYIGGGKIPLKCSVCWGGSYGVIMPNCYMCGGTGMGTGYEYLPSEQCNQCGGLGTLGSETTKVYCLDCIDGLVPVDIVCKSCDGIGTLVDKYLVEYDANGGSISTTWQIKSKGEDLVITVSPEREGYTFLGWSTSPTGDVEYKTGVIYEIDEDVTLYAVWHKWEEYIIHYELNGGIGTFSDQLKYEDRDIAISSITPKKEGFKFLGWSLIPNGEVALQPGDMYTLNEGSTLYAIWEELIKYTIHYDASGGTNAPAVQNKYKNVPLQISSDIPNKEGHTFYMWSSNPCGIWGGQYYRASETYSLNQDITLYAVWLKNCETCGGDGQVTNSMMCKLCNGNGQIIVSNHSLIYNESKAPSCTEEGWEAYESCQNCSYSTYKRIYKTNHTYGEWSIIEKASCILNGKMERECVTCGDKQTSINSGYEHEWNNYYTIDINPDCSYEGTKSIHCALCGAKQEDSEQVIPKKEHQWKDWIVIEDATCRYTGIKRGTCSVCNATAREPIEKIEHKWNEYYTIDQDSSCTEFGKESIHCSVCNAVREDSERAIAKKSHEYSKYCWTIKKLATCTSNGLKEGACSYCRKKATKVIGASGHKWNEDYTIDKEATCTENGTKSIHCAVCDVAQEESVKNIAKKSHDEVTDWAVQATYESDGKTQGSHCIQCGKVFNPQKNVAKLSSATLSSVKYTYNGDVRKPTVTVKDSNGVILKEGADYTATYASGRKSVGRYKVTLSFKGKYSGTKNLYFTIVPKAPASVTAKLSTSSGGYDDVKFSWKKSTGATGYNVYYKKSSSSKYTFFKATTGTSVTKKNLSDGVKYTFKVVPYYKSGNTKYYSSSQYKTASVTTLKKVTLSSVTKSGTKAKVKWKNISGETGYQISKSTTKKGTNIVSTYKTTSGTYKSVKATKGKKYYYKVRAYKVVDGKKVFGPWSDVKACTIKG